MRARPENQFVTMKTILPFLFLLALFLSLSSCAETSDSSVAARVSRPAQNTNAKEIAQQVAAIEAAPHSALPPAERTSVDANSQIAQMVITNDTNYSLTVLYSGPTAQSVMLSPKATQTVSLAVGSYRVAATVDAPDVRPFAGSDDLQGGSYNNTFYIETVRD